MPEHTSNVTEFDEACTKLKHYRMGGGSSDPIDHDIRIVARGMELALNLLASEKTIEGVQLWLPALKGEVEELFHIEDRARECIIALGRERDERAEQPVLFSPQVSDNDAIRIANDNAHYWKERFESSFCQRVKRFLTGRGSLV